MYATNFSETSTAKCALAAAAKNPIASSELQTLITSPIPDDNVRGILQLAIAVANYSNSTTLIPDSMGGCIYIWVTPVGEIQDIGWSASANAPISPVDAKLLAVRVVHCRIPIIGISDIEMKAAVNSCIEYAKGRKES